MEEFFKSLRAIGDTLQDSRIGNDRELAGMFDLTDPADYDVAALWQELAERKQAQDLAAMILGSPQVGATGAQAFQLAAMDEIERKRLSGHKPDTGGGGGDTSIYREGKAREKNLTPRPGDDGLSFRDSISNPYPKGKQPVFRPGHDYIEVDSSKLPPGSVIPDDVPPGQVTVKPTPLEELLRAIIKKGRFPR